MPLLNGGYSASERGFLVPDEGMLQRNPGGTSGGTSSSCSKYLGSINHDRISGEGKMSVFGMRLRHQKLEQGFVWLGQWKLEFGLLLIRTILALWNQNQASDSFFYARQSDRNVPYILFS